VEEDDGIPLTARAGGVVVQSMNANLDELPSHRAPLTGVPNVVIYGRIPLQLQDLQVCSGAVVQNRYR